MFIALPPPTYWVDRGLGQTVQQIQSMIGGAAAAYNVPNLAQVAEAVVSHESGYNPSAQNPSSSACGLFQLLNVTQQTLGVTNCKDPNQNINAAVPLLASYYQKYGNWPDALQAFSDGAGTVNAGQAPSSQTNGLVSYVQSQTGLDFSAPDSLDLTALGLPDLGGFSISSALGFPDVPDWVTWLGIGLAGAAAVAIVTRG